MCNSFLLDLKQRSSHIPLTKSLQRQPERFTSCPAFIYIVGFSHALLTAGHYTTGSAVGAAGKHALFASLSSGKLGLGHGLTLGLYGAESGHDVVCESGRRGQDGESIRWGSVSLEPDRR
ncbi:uncharacterized protein K444DRAFT_619436 [Hyaloscypha bicolor E]|uniref:Uncharacterized protein n=1 Tax=Hyaloscypha bicolor E TaxID=1095630 RepID=A0A2J6SPL6_9HELO|nr:uncharacterized protein K444DRAFT_619436 [Hyaloscypha bicolor E]PMD52722.1 hypothetical protein K444DRAFT_619436 [Hyaloscypha bicolor E]